MLLFVAIENEIGIIDRTENGVRGQGLKLISDNGCQPSSGVFLKITATMDIEQIFTSFNSPKGNAETERFMWTLKEECVWLEEVSSLNEARKRLSAWIGFYNNHYLHLALGIGALRNMSNFARKRNWEKPLEDYTKIDLKMPRL